MFSNSPEYEARLRKPFSPPKVTLKQLHDAVPKDLLRKDPLRSTGFIARDVVFCAALFICANYIEPAAHTGFGGWIHISAPWQIQLLKTLLWLSYWWWQGLVFTSFFCIAHELGHGTLYDSWYANNILGFSIHSFILVPFFAWKASHNAHHKAVGSIERDENYLPYLRSDFKLPPQERARRADYAEVFEETPLMTLGRLLVMQSCGWWLYLGCNAMGNKMLYPEGTNLLSPYSPVFKKEQRWGIFISDVALLVMGSVLVSYAVKYGWLSLIAYYFIPYMLCNHWFVPSLCLFSIDLALIIPTDVLSHTRIVMCTFLHHSDPTLPHYRNKEWSFLRGAVATVDRPILGWIGRFFFHNVSHDHVAHHLFSHAPFYNQPQITDAIKSILGEDYNYDSTNSFYALYRSFTECVFIEDEGDIVFYKNADGVAMRDVAKEGPAKGMQ
ncbi:fatty acid desaturase-domain-containing protein [Cristinia sonorae]|uniref:Fatty acid desaturase-domain-containing protein n=1 Tax=Cristinia sonorae TaxID=1940300 RepID=A0A8K0XKK1_9AGAR|nr:fatty acid desaturase-domain-containing protein [Cristinia sonorae]